MLRFQPQSQQVQVGVQKDNQQKLNIQQLTHTIRLLRSLPRPPRSLPQTRSWSDPVQTQQQMQPTLEVDQVQGGRR